MPITISLTMACSKPFRKINVDAHTDLWQNIKNNNNLCKAVAVSFRSISIKINVKNNACRGNKPFAVSLLPYEQLSLSIHRNYTYESA